MLQVPTRREEVRDSQLVEVRDQVDDRPRRGPRIVRYVYSGAPYIYSRCLRIHTATFRSFRASSARDFFVPSTAGRHNSRTSFEIVYSFASAATSRRRSFVAASTFIVIVSIVFSVLSVL
mgnify:CR=1 FL=1